MAGLLRVPFFDDEILPSFISRFATANGRPAEQFCRDHGVKYRSAIKGEATAIAKFASLCGQEERKLQHSALRFGERHATTFLGETFGKYDLVKNSLRFCPDCFSHDLAATDRMPGTQRYLRAAWLLKEFRTCPIHCREIAELEPHLKSRRLGLPELLNKRADEIAEKSLAAARRMPSTLETYIYRRFSGHSQQDELSEIQLAVITDYSRLLGHALTYGKHNRALGLPSDAIDAATIVGFDRIVSGRESFDAALDELLAQDEHRPRGLSGAYGVMYTIISQYRPWNAYDVFRDWINDHAGRHVVIRSAKSDMTLPTDGEWISIATIAKSTGLGRSLVKRRLFDAGIIDTKKAVAVPRSALKLFDRMRGSRITAKKAAAILGCTSDLMIEMAVQGLIPRLDLNENVAAKTASKKRTKLYLERDVCDLKEKLTKAPRVQASEDLASVRVIARRLGVTQTSIIAKIVEGEYQVAGTSGNRSLTDNLLMDVNKVLPRRPDDYVLAGEAVRLLGIHSNTMSKLLAKGVLTAYRDQQKSQHFPRQIISKAEIETFRQQYSTISQLAEATGINRSELSARAKKRGIQPAFPSAEVLAFFVRSEDVLRLISSP
ncbi:TniQ family protein [Rhizobium sp.]|uniref:TniQ family protein n=1 Tax=Rhizobium sp. TaxID=391 RepID=UPI0028AD8E28